MQQPLTPALVRIAYLIILGRDAESVAAVQEAITYGSLENLCRALLTSSAFRERLARLEHPAASPASSPVDSQTPDPASAIAGHQHVMAALHIRDLPEARRRASELLSDHPNFMPGYFVACEAFRASDMPGDADDIALNAMRRFPNEPWPATYYAHNAIRWQNWEEAQRRYEALIERFPSHPQSYEGTAHALGQIGLHRKADSILSDAITLFPTARGVHAEYVASAIRQENWPETILRLRLVFSRLPEDRGIWMDVNRALWKAGQNDDAEAVLVERLERFPVDLDLFTIRIEVALARDDVATAMHFWKSHVAGLAQPWHFLELTGRLLRAWLWTGGAVSDAVDLARVLIRQEPTGDAWWVPPLLELFRQARVAGQRELDERLTAAVLQALTDDSELSLTHILCRLYLDKKMPEEEFLRLADFAFRYYRDGNLCIKLFDAEYRTAADARRYIARYLTEGQPATSHFAGDIGADAIDIARCFMLLASVCDAEALDEMLRRLRAAALPQPSLASAAPWHAMIGHLAPAFRLPGDAPAIVSRLARPLRIALCVSGQLRGFQSAGSSWHKLGLDGHEVVTSVHTWRNIGRRMPDNAWQASRGFTGHFRDELVRVSGFAGFSGLIERYPKLFATFRVRKEIAEQELREFYRTEFIAIEDDAEPPFRSWRNETKMYYKVEKAHDQALQAGPFDLVIRMRPDKEVVGSADLDWERVLHESRNRRTVFCDNGWFINIGYGYCIGDQFAAGTAECMARYSRTYSFFNDARFSGVKWLPKRLLPHAGFAYSAFCAGIRCLAMGSLYLGELLSDDPLSGREVLPLLREDIGAMPRDDIDERLLQACQQDIGSVLV